MTDTPVDSTPRDVPQEKQTITRYMTITTPTPRQFIWLLVCGLFFLAGTLVVTAQWAHRQGLNELAEESAARLELYVAYLQGVLEKYEILPELLATNERLVALLQKPDDHDRITALNIYLETINTISDSADTYLMDSQGLTIASSNWRASKSFVGSNFGYRPYFQEAMQGKLGRYFALGTTSSQRGYYFAYPVRHDGAILGVLVIKIDIDSVEDAWIDQGNTFLVTDPYGVIFIATDARWRYRTLHPLKAETVSQIEESKRYPDTTLQPLNIINHDSRDGFNIISLRNKHDKKTKKYLHDTISMSQAGWEVQILAETGKVEQFVWRTVLGISTFFMLGFLCVMLLWQHRQRLAERYRYEEKSRRMLEDANEVLESRVTTRTLALTRSNLTLRQEIEERAKTEEALQRTRSELVHAAKLAAIGQMSAGITHELNQPLAAIRTYTDNAVQFLHKDRQDNVFWNLEQIGELTDRMAKISTQLKLFARKSTGKLSVVPLHGSVDGALEILAPIIRKSGAEINIKIFPEDLELKANNVLLQQVLVNLLNNALQATENQEEKIIWVHAAKMEKIVLLTIEDNGPGIAKENLKKIFDPFFTTKEPGKGLGLGLTITSRIIREMDGEILVADATTGTRFEIRLKAGK